MLRHIVMRSESLSHTRLERCFAKIGVAQGCFLLVARRNGTMATTGKKHSDQTVLGPSSTSPCNQRARQKRVLSHCVGARVPRPPHIHSRPREPNPLPPSLEKPESKQTTSIHTHHPYPHSPPLPQAPETEAAAPQSASTEVAGLP